MARIKYILLALALLLIGPDLCLSQDGASEQMQRDSQYLHVREKVSIAEDTQNAIDLLAESLQKEAEVLQVKGYAYLSRSRIWYHSIGDTCSPAILCLHGGPGGTCYSLYPLAELSDAYRVILFDQPGGGRSNFISDTSMMNLDFFVSQLKEFVSFLGLEKFYIYGHSWGTMLALDYYMEHPEGIEAMIMNSPLVSTELWERDADTLIQTLPDTIQQFIAISEQSNSYDNPGFKQAIRAYYWKYIRRNPRITTPYDVPRKAGNDIMYNYMWGPSEFTATGTLKTYDRLDILPGISIPTLWITGEFDEARPVTVKYYSSLTPGSSFAVIEDAAHATMHDNPEDNLILIRQFLGRTRSNQSPLND